MKTSIVLIFGIFLNTTLLLAKPISMVIDSLNVWILVWVQVILILGYSMHKILRDLQDIGNVDFGNLDVFVLQGKGMEK